MKGVALVNASELKGLFFINITNYIGKLLLRHLLTLKCIPFLMKLQQSC